MKYSYIRHVGLCALLLIVLFVPIVSAEGGYSYVTRWGSDGKGDGYFNGPQGIAVDTAGNVYVADFYNCRIQKFSSTGAFISKWGHEGKEDGLFARPLGVAVDSAGNVYVADNGNQRIQKFDSSGNFLAKWGQYGHEDSQFSDLQGIAVDSAGNVYVVDTGNQRIQKFTSTGTFITKWGYAGSRDAEFSNPHDVAVDSAGNVYVTDAGNQRVQKFTSTGTFVMDWGYAGTDDGLFGNPQGIAVDSAGNVYVADSGNGRIQKFTSAGTFVTKFGKEDSINSPSWIAVDGPGNIYIVSAGKILKYAQGGSGTGPSSIATTGSGTTTKTTTAGPTVAPSNGGGGQPPGQSPDYLMLFLVGAGALLIGGIVVKGRSRGKPPQQKAKPTKPPISGRIIPSLGKARSHPEGVHPAPDIVNREVMISYSKEDKAIADEICAGLEARGIWCWIAPRNILHGTEYQEAIVDAINASRILVLVLSSQSNESPFVKREVTLALSKRVTIIPFKIEDVPPSKTMEFLISTPQWLDAFTPPLEGHINNLAETIKTLLKNGT